MGAMVAFVSCDCCDRNTGLDSPKRTLDSSEARAYAGRCPQPGGDHMTRAATLALAVLLGALLLAAVGASSALAFAPSGQPLGLSLSGAAGSPLPGGTYNFPLAAEPISIAPLNTQESEGNNVEHQCFQGLYVLKRQPDGTTAAVPDLAETTAVNSKATVFTFTIKRGVKFGPPVNRTVTAQDFVKSWNYCASAANQSATVYILAPIKGVDPYTGYAGRNGLTGVKATGKYALQVTLKYPFADFPSTLVHPITHVFPVDYAKKVGRKAYSGMPVGGTGPYLVQRWRHYRSIRLIKNPHYWNTAGSGNSAAPGYVDAINMPIYADTGSEWLAFQRGKLDCSTVPAGNARAVESDPNVTNGTWTARAYPSNAVYFISFAMNHPLLGGANQGGNQPIRAALNYAADRDTVCNVVNEGISIPTDEIVPASMPGYQPGLNPYPYDPSKAQLELDKFTAAGGKLPSTIPFWYNSGSGHDRIALALIAGWQKAMPSLTFKRSGIEANSYWTQMGGGKAPALFRMGWIADYPSIDNFIYLFTTGGGKYGSYSRYKNPQVDALFRQARSTLDAATRNDLYNQAQKLILTDAPCIPVYTYGDFRVTNNRIGGFNYNSFGLVDMWGLWVK